VVYISSLNALLEGRRAEALTIMREFDRFLLGPEESMYVARQFVYLGEVEEGARRVLANVEKGWGNVRFLSGDPWFAAARGNANFEKAVAQAQATRDLALAAFQAG
jgi:hypothetical protein